MGTVLLSAFHCTFEYQSGVDKFQFVNWWQNIFILEVRPCRSFFSVFIVYFCIDTVLGLIVNPLANEKLVLVMVEVRTLAFTHVVHPVAFKMIAVTFC